MEKLAALQLQLKQAMLSKADGQIRYEYHRQGYLKVNWFKTSEQAHE